MRLKWEHLAAATVGAYLWFILIKLVF